MYNQCGFTHDTLILGKKFLKKVYTWFKPNCSNIILLIMIMMEFEWAVLIISRWIEQGNVCDSVHTKSLAPYTLSFLTFIIHLFIHSSRIIF